MYLTAIAVIAMAALALRRRAPSRAFWIAPLVLVAQIALGAINVWAGKHAGLIIGHLRARARRSGRRSSTRPRP